MSYQCSLVRLPGEKFATYYFYISEELEIGLAEEIASWEFRLDAEGKFARDLFEVYIKADCITFTDAFEYLKNYPGIEPYIKEEIVGMLANALLVAKEPFHNIEYYRFPPPGVDRTTVEEMETTVYGRAFIENVFMYYHIAKALRPTCR